MNVRDLMRSPAPTVQIDTPVSEVARLILDQSLAGVAVVDQAGNLRGAVTQAELVAKHARVHAPLYMGILGGVLPLDTRRTQDELRHVLAVTAGELLSDADHRINFDADIDDAASRMVDDRLDPLLVLDGGRLVGTLSRVDVIRLLLREELDSDGTPHI